MKEPRIKQPKPWTQGAILLHRSKNVETSNKAWKEKKDQRRRSQRSQKSSTLATGVNAAEPGKLNKKKKKNQRKMPYNMSDITYYNCDKIDHYLNSYLESPKN